MNDTNHRHEAVVPDFRTAVALGGEPLTEARFTGRTTTTVSRDVPIAQLMRGAKPGATRPLTFRRDGAGTLFYTARLR